MLTKPEEEIAGFDKKYGEMAFDELDKKARDEGLSIEEEDDWFKWGNLIYVRDLFLDNLIELEKHAEE